MTIDAVDVYGNSLDADPQTVARLVWPLRSDGGPWWLGYESEFAGPNTARGGVDRWHELGSGALGEWWVETDEVSQRKHDFYMVRRGDRALVYFDHNRRSYRGTIGRERLELSHRFTTVRELLGVDWYDEEYRLVDKPPWEALMEVIATRGGTGDVKSWYEMKRTGEDEFRGELRGFFLRWDEEGRLTEFISPGRPFPKAWARKQPATTTPAEGKPAGKPLPRAKPRVESFCVFQMEYHRRGTVHILDFPEIRYREERDSAALVVTVYPATVMSSTRPDRLVWSVRWDAGHVRERREAKGQAEVAVLRKQAEQLRKGGFGKAEIADKMKERFGDRAEPLGP